MLSDSFKAFCTDFYVNQKVTVKMDLPRGRETVLDLFERVRKQFPGMNQFRKYRDELALESPQGDGVHRWLALRSNNIRSGTVNPANMPEAYALHLHVLEAAPFFMNISPLDVDYLELLYGFDIAAGGNHDAIVLDALLAGSPLASLVDVQGATPIDFQPMIGMALGQQVPGQRGEYEVHFEIKTRPSAQSAPARDPDAGEPISVYLTLRKFGSIGDLKELSAAFRKLAAVGEELVENRVVPRLLVPIRDVIVSGN
ncbi:MAG: hypothetical protein SFY96_14635 [Planctomycetota bacterium]|jgi:hypothetical protein|nr:hypothetical protein [Planctomycetota bacterium]